MALYAHKTILLEIRHMNYRQTIFVLALPLFFTACAQDLIGAEKRNSNASIPENTMIKRNSANKTITYLKGEQLLRVAPASKETFKNQCLDFIHTHSNDFHIKNAKNEFTIVSSEKDELGHTHIKLDQQYNNIPVWNGSIIMHFDSENQLYLVYGEYFPTPSNLDTDPMIKKEEAIAKAQKYDAEIGNGKFSSEQIIFFKNEITPRMAYQLKATSQHNFKDKIYVIDAQTGEILNQLQAVQTN
jgi:Zn-dependent metalloprotease